MSDKDHMQNLLGSMLNPDNNVRNQAENLLLETAKQNTALFVQTILPVLGNPETPREIKNVSCLVLKKTLTVFESDIIKGYRNLDDNFKGELQKAILVLLSQEQHEHVREQICDFVSDLAGSILLDDSFTPEQQWPSLTQHLLELFATGNDVNIISVFRIFEGLFSHVSSHFSQHSANIAKMFEAGFAHTSIKINLSCLECLSSLVSTLRAKDIKPYRPFSAHVLQLIVKVLATKDEEDLQTCLGNLFDVCESEPLFMKNSLDDMITVLASVRAFDSDPDSSLKTESVECLVLLVERYPVLVKENGMRLTRIVELIFMNMMDIDDTVPAEWASPADGFNDDLEGDDDQKCIKVGMDFVDRLMIACPDVMLKMMNDFVATLLTQPNWKMHHAAIMAMSQIGEYIFDKIETDVPNIVNLVSQFSSNENPRIRYACCHLLGQFAEDLNPNFQEMFHEQYFKIVLPLLNDKIPRVVAHALASLTNFLENSSEEIVGQNFGFIFERILYWINNGIGYVKEACFSTLSALCESSSETFKSVFQQSMQMIFFVLDNSKSATFKQLRGNAIECATIIGKLCGEDIFKNYHNELIQRMIVIQNSDIDLSKFDPQTAYILAAWQRIVMTLKDDFGPYVPIVLPRLLQIIQNTASQSTDSVARTSESEETDVAVQTINILIDEVGQFLLPYITQIFDSLSQIIEKTLNEEIKVDAIKCLPSILKLLVKSKTPFEEFGRHLNTKLWNLMDKEYDCQTLCEYAFVEQKIIKNMGPVLSDNEINDIYLKCIEQLKRSWIRKTEVEDNFDKEEENKEEIDKIIENDNELEDEFSLEIANIIGVIFKVYKNRTLNIFNQVYQSLIIPSFGKGTTKATHFGLFLIDDSVEHLGQFMPREILKEFLEIVSRYTVDESLEIRQAASFGIGIIAAALEGDFLPYRDKVFELLVRSINVQKKEDDYPKFYFTVKENGVASFGKILQMSLASMDMQTAQNSINYWFSHLPIVHDHKEGLHQHKFLLSLITDPRGFFNFNDENTLHKILTIFATIHKKKKICDDEIRTHIKTVIDGFKSNAQIAGLVSKMTLSQEIQDFVAALN